MGGRVRRGGMRLQSAQTNARPKGGDLGQGYNWDVPGLIWEVFFNAAIAIY